MIYALDGALLGKGSTGDSAYWEGLVAGIAAAHPAKDSVRVFCNGPLPKDWHRPHGIEFVELPRVSSRWHSLVRWPLAARRARADVLHTQYFLSPLAGNRGITTVHDISFVHGPEWFRPRDRWILTHGVRSSVRRARAVVTVSETSRKEIVEWMPSVAAKVHAIPNGLGLDFRDAESVSRGDTPPHYVVTVGTRWPRKNQEVAVEAVRRYREVTGDDLRLVITGRAGWGDESDHPWIHRPGYVSLEELKGLFSGARALVFPSLHEGFGIPVLEAWCTRTPVICSDRGALPEVAGDAAWICSATDVDAWVRALQELLADSGKVALVVQKGTERLPRFSWEESARQHLDLYRRCAL